jgi:membrane-associated phospholipid phosphatase
MRKQLKSMIATRSGVLVLCFAAGCSDVPSAPQPSSTQRLASSSRIQTVGAESPPATLQWNAKAIALASKNFLRPPNANRAYMLVSVAEAAALGEASTLEDDESLSDNGERGPDGRAGALGGAAVVVLTYLFPAEQQDLESTLAALRDAATHLKSFDAGVARGRAAGQRVADLARTDGSDAVVVPTIPVGPGFWTTPGPVLTPQWPFVRPMLMTSGNQFRPGPPPAFGSTEFLAALQRVRDFSDTRTPEQLAAVNFWNDPAGIGNHGAHWNHIAISLILRDNLSERRAVRVLEHLNLALSDAAIACMDAKYTYWLIRPYQVDPLITTPIGQPIHPSYPSLHSCQGGAAVGVLAHEFPLDAEMLRGLGAQMDLSREWAGLHYNFDTRVGTAIGHQIADLANALGEDESN